MYYKKSAKQNKDKKSTISTIIILLLLIALLGLYMVLGDKVQTFISGLINSDPITIDKVESINLTNETLTLSKGDYEITLYGQYPPETDYQDSEGKIIDFIDEGGSTFVRVYIKTVENDSILGSMTIGTVVMPCINLDIPYHYERLNTNYEPVDYNKLSRSARLNILADDDSVTIPVRGFSTDNAEYNGDWTISGFEYTLNLLED